MKTNVAVIGGGNSSEYVISVKSAAMIAETLDKEKYNVFIVSMHKNDWHVPGDEYGNAPVSKDDFSFMHKGRKINFGFAYITIHGTPGEDGILPAYFELLGIPHSTCDVLISALTFNKYFCKSVIKYHGILTPAEVMVTRKNITDAAHFVKKLGLPVFVKPNNGGSSFGVTKVSREEDIVPAIRKAFEEDNEHDVIIEKFIAGTEVTCGMVVTGDRQIV
ncbi:MAG: D-alanine--D-alanine ligase, partial [Bacteroidetes bacterium]|nr:D-alanine--D-alanine ligase [Bacteroidota bacterium]